MPRVLENGARRVTEDGTTVRTIEGETLALLIAQTRDKFRGIFNRVFSRVN